MLPPDNPRVLAYVRRDPRAAPVLCLACFSDQEEHVSASTLASAGWLGGPGAVLLHASQEALQWRDGGLVLGAWQFAWVRLGEDAEAAPVG